MPTCDGETGKVIPVINPKRCEAKADCVAVCPYDVFDIRTLAAEELAALPWLSRLKVRAHGGKQAFVVRADTCNACGLCVKACPERAITLQKVARGS